jgi:CheY-like chemotaxis protein
MRLQDARILFVDDEPFLLDIFSLWITGAKRDLISTAADGLQALEMMAENEYDLLVTDVNMPRLNGVDLVRRMAGVGILPPSIVFVSGFGGVDEREMYGLGVEAFLEKPVLRQTLLETMEHALAARGDLWATPLESPPRHSVSIEAVDFRDSALNGGIALGRGGFSAPYPNPVAQGKISFDCHLSALDLRFSGEGYVRWRSKVEGTIGVEFAYLNESCRGAIVEEINRSCLRAFIPAQ